MSLSRFHVEACQEMSNREQQEAQMTETERDWRNRNRDSNTNNGHNRLV